MALKFNVKEILTLNGMYGNNALLYLIQDKCRGTVAEELSSQEIRNILHIKPDSDEYEHDFSCDITNTYVARLKKVNKINLVLYDNAEHMVMDKNKSYTVVYGYNDKMAKRMLAIYSYVYRNYRGYILSPNGKKYHMSKFELKGIAKRMLNNPRLHIYLWFIVTVRRYKTREELVGDIFVSSFFTGLAGAF